MNLFAAELQRAVADLGGMDGGLDEDSVFLAVERLHQRAVGSFSVVAMITGWGVVAIRDKNGIRPLCMGSREVKGKTEWIFASESVALDVLDFKLERDVAPGETVIIRSNGAFSSKVTAPNGEHRPCIFEHVYFSRPDSTIDGISVHDARLRMGRLLGREYWRRGRPTKSTSWSQSQTAEESQHWRWQEPWGAIPRGFRQEPIYRQDIHHAGPECQEGFREEEIEHY